DLDERADWRLVDRDDHIVEREFLAVLLVAEPGAEPELLEDADEHRSIGDDRLELFAQLERRGLHRSFERHVTLARLDPDAQHTTAPPQAVVGRVEQAVLLKAAAANRRRAGLAHRGAGRLDVRKPELDLALEGGCHGRLFKCRSPSDYNA